MSAPVYNTQVSIDHLTERTAANAFLNAAVRGKADVPTAIYEAFPDQITVETVQVTQDLSSEYLQDDPDTRERILTELFDIENWARNHLPEGPQHGQLTRPFRQMYSG